MSVSHPLNSYMETWVPLCGTVVVSQWPHFCSHTLVRMYTCISTCIHVHLTPHVCSSPIRGETSNWRWELHLEVRLLINGWSSSWRWDLWFELSVWLEVPPVIGGLISDWRSPLWLELPPPIRHLTSNWSSHLKSEVPPLIGGLTLGRYFSYHLGWSQYLITSHVFISWIQAGGQVKGVPRKGTPKAICRYHFP